MKSFSTLVLSVFMLLALVACAADGGEPVSPSPSFSPSDSASPSQSQPPSEVPSPTGERLPLPGNSSAPPSPGESTFTGTLEIEGTFESVTYTLYTDPEGKFTIGYDKNYLAVSEEANDPGTASFTSVYVPEWSMKIYLSDGGGVNETFENTKQSFDENGYTMYAEDEVSIGDGYEARHIIGADTGAGTVYHMYFVSTEKLVSPDHSAGCYVILLTYGSEASEGLGVRMSAMADTFRYIG